MWAVDEIVYASPRFWLRCHYVYVVANTKTDRHDKNLQVETSFKESSSSHHTTLEAEVRYKYSNNTILLPLRGSFGQARRSSVEF